MDLILLMDKASDDFVNLSAVVMQEVATGRSVIVKARSQRKEVTCHPDGYLSEKIQRPIATVTHG